MLFHTAHDFFKQTQAVVSKSLKQTVGIFQCLTIILWLLRPLTSPSTFSGTGLTLWVVTEFEKLVLQRDIKARRHSSSFLRVRRPKMRYLCNVWSHGVRLVQAEVIQCTKRTTCLPGQGIFCYLIVFIRYVFWPCSVLALPIAFGQKP